MLKNRGQRRRKDTEQFLDCIPYGTLISDSGAIFLLTSLPLSHSLPLTPSSLSITELPATMLGLTQALGPSSTPSCPRNKPTPDATCSAHSPATGPHTDARLMLILVLRLAAAAGEGGEELGLRLTIWLPVPSPTSDLIPIMAVCGSAAANHVHAVMTACME